MISDFKDEKEKKYYVIFDLLRYFFICIAVCFYKRLIFLQLFLILFVQLFFYIRIIIIGKPFLVKWNYRVSLINEFLICSAFFASFCIYLCQKLKNKNTRLKVGFGWVIIFANILLIFVLLINFFKFTYDILILAKSNLNLNNDGAKRTSKFQKRMSDFKKKSIQVFRKVSTKFANIIRKSKNDNLAVNYD